VRLPVPVPVPVAVPVPVPVAVPVAVAVAVPAPVPVPALVLTPLRAKATPCASPCFGEGGASSSGGPRSPPPIELPGLLPRSRPQGPGS